MSRQFHDYLSIKNSMKEILRVILETEILTQNWHSENHIHFTRERTFLLRGWLLLLFLLAFLGRLAGLCKINRSTARYPAPSPETGSGHPPASFSSLGFFRTNTFLKMFLNDLPEILLRFFFFCSWKVVYLLFKMTKYKNKLLLEMPNYNSN